MQPNGLQVSFPVQAVLGAEVLMPIVGQDDAWYNAFYRYEQRGAQLFAVLTRVEEIMPAVTPQASRCDDQCRLPMMHPDGSLDFEAEAKQRRKEWAEINAA